MLCQMFLDTVPISLSLRKIQTFKRLQSPADNTQSFPSPSACHRPPPHLFWPRSGVLRSTSLILVPTYSERTGLPSWKVAWSYVENFSSYSRSKLIKFSMDFFGIFQGSSNFSTYRNEVCQDIFSYSGNRWRIW